MTTRNALISVYDKAGITEFAHKLASMGWTLLASGGTARVLTDAKLPVTDVAGLVGEAILGHRVVTLSREIHAGLLARPDIPEDLAELKKLGVPFFDLVCVDLYPLAKEIAKPNTTPESVIEQTDIGGPTILRSAAKGRRIVVSHANQRQPVLDWLTSGESNAKTFRNHLAAAAEFVVAEYCLTSARYHSVGDFDGLTGVKVQPAKYGENAWQIPAGLFHSGSSDPLAADQFRLAAGADPSYNNLAELDRHLQTITHIAAAWDRNFGHTPLIAIGTKHGNACGAAVGNDPATVIRKMVTGDPRAIFGGLVSVNFEITADLATELLAHQVEQGRRLLDAVIAPSFTTDAVKLLSRKGDKCRFLKNPALAKLNATSLDTQPRFRPVRGGFLRQPNYTYIIDLKSPDIAKTGRLTDTQQQDLVLAWAVCATSNSNTITIVKDQQLIGNGVGQQDRVGCCELAVKRATDAGHTLTGAVAASDSFFPFPDAPQTLIDAGIEAIWATSGSVRDAASQDLCAEHHVALWQVPDTTGRGFFGH